MRLDRAKGVAKTVLLTTAWMFCESEKVPREQALQALENCYGALRSDFAKEVDDKAILPKNSPTKKQTLDLSQQPENLDITAQQFSGIVNNLNLPKEYKSILDTYCEVKQ